MECFTRLLGTETLLVDHSVVMVVESNSKDMHVTDGYSSARIFIAFKDLPCSISCENNVF
jgi:hypothetical protein